jgi:hypothetical protein
MGDIASILRPRERAEWSQDYGINDYVGWLSALGYGFPYSTTMGSHEEPIAGDFTGLTQGVYRGNSVGFACLMTRLLLFSQARFQFQQMRGGQPGDLFGTADLSLIENPEPGKVTADLLALGILDADLAGDWFGVRRPGRITRLRPDFTTIIVGSPNPDSQYPAWDPDAEMIGVSYLPGGPGGGGAPISFEAGEVAHFAPIPDPLMRWRGMPLPTAAIRDLRGDTGATSHKLAFFENAGTPNLVVKFPERTDAKKAEQMIDVFEQEHVGAFNAYRTIFLLGGASIEAVGKDLQQLDFAAVQGKGETRIVAAMGLHPSVVPVSEGLQGSALNSGNFGPARRLVADKTLRPYWGNFAASLQTIVPPPGGSRLWYDDRHIPFLAEDVKDAAEVIGMQMTAIRTAGDGGWIPETAVDAIVSGDLRRLRHSGYLPVQVQPIQGAQTQPDKGAQAAATLLSLPGYATRRPTLEDVIGSQAPHGLVARRTFWAASGPFEGETVREGTWVPEGHELVRSFPSMFDPLSRPLPASAMQPIAVLAAAHPNGKE